jgi:hypothetical protein
VNTLRRRLHTATLIVVGTWLIAACATAPASTPAAPPTLPASDTTPAPQPVAIAEPANHTTVQAHAGQLVQLNLKSLYWSDPVSSSSGVLAADGAVNRTPDRRCPMGGGCGTLTARFRAASPGTAQVTAHRSSCGEAMGCSTDQRDFTVTVVVT